MAFHLGRPEAAGGFLGVDVFFVLSGFLITDLLLREETRRGSISLRRFYTRRALRLFPALGAVLVVALALALAWRNQPWSPETLDGLPFVIVYAGNWYRAFGDEATLGLLVHTWSLAIEEQFYLVWPWVVILLSMSGIRRRARIAPALLIAATLIALWRLGLAEHGASQIRLASGLDSHADGLLLGAAVAYVLSGAGPLSQQGRRVTAVATFAAVVALIGLTVGLSPDVKAAEFGYFLAAAATAVVVIGLATQSVPRLTKLLELPPLVWIGRRSYGLYLWHFPIFLVVADRTVAGVRGSYWALAATFAVAELSFRYIEKPFLRLKSRSD
jgi:peptidoglycan/LPS O-acetylase OafA/YrhL